MSCWWTILCQKTPSNFWQYFLISTVLQWHFRKNFENFPPADCPPRSQDYSLCRCNIYPIISFDREKFPGEICILLKLSQYLFKYLIILMHVFEKLPCFSVLFQMWRFGSDSRKIYPRLFLWPSSEKSYLIYCYYMAFVVSPILENEFT